MTPTQRSVIARLRYRSLEAKPIEKSLRRATRIKVLPRIAVLDKKVLRTERKISWLCTSPMIFIWDEQSSSSISFWLISLVKFLTAILLQCMQVNKCQSVQ